MRSEPITTTIGVGTDTRAKLGRLMHKRELRSLGATVNYAVEVALSKDAEA